MKPPARDACVDPNATLVLIDKTLPIWVGVDASVKHDSTAICVLDGAASLTRLVRARQNSWRSV